MLPEASSVALPGQSESYFARHWRGELSLPRSYWINGVLIFGLGCNVGFAIIVGLSAVLLRQTPVVAVIIILAEMALNVTAYIWALVGTWRSAGRYQGSRFWAILARVAIVFGVLLSITHIMQNLAAIESLFR